MAQGEVDLSDQVFITLAQLARASRMTRTRAFRYYSRLGALRQLPGEKGAWFTTPPLLQLTMPETWAYVVSIVLEQREKYDGASGLQTRDHRNMIGPDRS